MTWVEKNETWLSTGLSMKSMGIMDLALRPQKTWPRETFSDLGPVRKFPPTVYYSGPVTLPKVSSLKLTNWTGKRTGK